MSLFLIKKYIQEHEWGERDWCNISKFIVSSVSFLPHSSSASPSGTHKYLRALCSLYWRFPLSMIKQKWTQLTRDNRAIGNSSISPFDCMYWIRTHTLALHIVSSVGLSDKIIISDVYWHKHEQQDGRRCESTATTTYVRRHCSRWQLRFRLWNDVWTKYGTWVSKRAVCGSSHGNHSISYFRNYERDSCSFVLETILHLNFTTIIIFSTSNKSRKSHWKKTLKTNRNNLTWDTVEWRRNKIGNSSSFAEKLWNDFGNSFVSWNISVASTDWKRCKHCNRFVQWAT